MVFFALFENLFIKWILAKLLIILELLKDLWYTVVTKLIKKLKGEMDYETYKKDCKISV